MRDEQQNLSYLECNLPSYLEKDLIAYKKALAESSTLLDCYYCELQDDINCAEVDQEISSLQAKYLREKYL